MEFGVLHEIGNFEAWQEAVEANPEYPPELHLHVFVGAVDKSRAFCVWRAPSADALQEWLDQVFGHAAVNHVFPVDVNLIEPLAA